jgi:exonuclease III
MKLLTWNCCRGTFSKKVPLLEQFNSDIYVIQECGKPESQSDTCLWFGDNPKQGIAIKSSNGYRLLALPAYADVPKFVFPVLVSGPETFLMLVVWSKGKQKFRYVMGVVKAIEIYKPLIERTTTVVIGDLNSNAIWNNSHPKHLNHSALIASLEALGIVSAYHHFFNELHGLETRPTCFLLWKKARPYHIDFCFIPKAWLPRLQSVHVGSYEDWSLHSDHRPLLVALSDSH